MLSRLFPFVDSAWLWLLIPCAAALLLLSQVLNRGLEMSAQQVYDGTSEDEHTHVRVYLSCILVGKRALARTRTQRAPLRSGNLPGTSAMVSGPPPNAFCAWLRSQPLSHAVAAALDVLEREPKVTGHGR